jgi:iron-sulfur cluster assembly protein
MGAPAFTVLPAAEQFMRRMLRLGGGPSAGFRLHVSAGGCSGYSSGFSVEAAPKEGDAVVDVNGLRVFLSAPSVPLLEGVTVDCVDSPMQSGLVFTRGDGAPCACGSVGGGHPPAEASVSLASLKRR